MMWLHVEPGQESPEEGTRWEYESTLKMRGEYHPFSCAKDWFQLGAWAPAYDALRDTPCPLQPIYLDCRDVGAFPAVAFRFLIGTSVSELWLDMDEICTKDSKKLT